MRRPYRPLREWLLWRLAELASPYWVGDRRVYGSPRIYVRTLGSPDVSLSPDRIAELKKLLEKATPGPWYSNEEIREPGNDECDAATSLYDDWVTFNTRRPEADRALFIALVNAAPALLARKGK